MTTFNWNKLAGGDFSTAADWTPSGPPGAADDADIDALGRGAYTVTVSTSETISELQMNANATLEVLVGTPFTVTEGSGTGVLAGLLEVSNGGTLTAGGTMDNKGRINLNSQGAVTALVVNGLGLTLSGGGNVNLGASEANEITGLASGDTLTNVDNTIAGSGQIGGGQMTLINQAKGVIDATGIKGDFYSIVINTSGRTLTNAGLLEASENGTLTIQSTIVDGSTGGVILAGTTGIVALKSADILGGTLQSQQNVGDFIAVADNGVVFDGSASTVDNQALVQIYDGAGLTLKGAIDNAGGTIHVGSTGDTTSLKFSNATLTGAGLISTSDSSANYLDVTAPALVNVDNTIAGAGRLVGAVTNEALGVIDANGASNALYIDNNSQVITNAGLIEATGAAGLKIGGVGSGALVDGRGGGVILAANGSVVTLANVNLTGGDLKTAGTGLIDVAGDEAIFFSAASYQITNSGQVQVLDNASLDVEGPLDNSGAITLVSGAHGATLRIGTGGATLTGGGSVVLSGYSALDVVTGDVLTNVDNTISGSGQLGNGHLTLINQANGVIDATGLRSLVLDTAGETVTNAGTLEATGGDGLIIQSSTIAGTGGKILVSANTSVALDASTLRGGTLSTAGGGLFQIANGSSAALDGVVTNAGTIELASSGSVTTLTLNATTSLSGGGVVDLNDAANNVLDASRAGYSLTNVDNTIEGAGRLGAHLVIINDAGGTIDADGAAGAALTIDTKGFSLGNSGLVEATGLGGLVLSTDVSNQPSGVILAGAGSKVTLKGARIIGGTLETAGAGKIVTASGYNVLSGVTSTLNNTGTVSVTNATGLTIEGAIHNTGQIALAGKTQATVLNVGPEGVTFSGGGAVSLGADVYNIIVGASDSVTLTNVDNKISGGGFLGDGQMELSNMAAGVIDATGAVALTIDTGANTVVNAGLIEAAGTGGGVIESAVANSGVLKAAGGNLTVVGAVSGSGTALISTGELDFMAAFNQNVTFSGAFGTLQLAQSQAFGAAVSGFSKEGGTALDLDDIRFESAGEATFSGNKTGGVLTVTDGTDTAHIRLVGNYSKSSFTAASDGHNGTIVRVMAPQTPATLPLIAAAAALGAGAAGHSMFGQDTRQAASVMLAVLR